MLTQNITLAMIISLGSILQFKAILAQERSELERSNKALGNTVYGTFGTMALASSANLNYERMMISFNKGIVNSIWVKVGYGAWWSGYAEDQANYYLIGPTFLFFSGKSHFEIDLYAPQYGSFEFWDTSRPVPGFAIGYRFQKNSEGLVFRIGGGQPEFAYLSFGFCF